MQQISKVITALLGFMLLLSALLTGCVDSTEEEKTDERTKMPSLTNELTSLPESKEFSISSEPISSESLPLEPELVPGNTISYRYSSFPSAENEQQILGVVIDYGFGDYKKDFPSFTPETFISDENGSNFLIIPKYKDSSIRVQQIHIEADGSFTVDKTLFESNPKNQETALLLQAILPESAPRIQVVVTHNGKSAVWRLSYNGKDGTLLVPNTLKAVSVN